MQDPRESHRSGHGLSSVAVAGVEIGKKTSGEAKVSMEEGGPKPQVAHFGKLRSPHPKGPWTIIRPPSTSERWKHVHRPDGMSASRRHAKDKEQKRPESYEEQHTGHGVSLEMSLNNKENLAFS